MIPPNADDATLARYVANILAAWHAASAEDMAQGRAWYHVAHDLAGVIGAGSVPIGAGVIAALSPQCPWERNVTLARDVCTTGIIRGHMTEALGKVARIMGGEDPARVLPNGSKTWNFYHNMLYPSSPDFITVDRHAHDVAVGEAYGKKRDRGLSYAPRYATLARAYLHSGRELDEIAAVVQPVTWCYWRRTHGKAS